MARTLAPDRERASIAVVAARSFAQSDIFYPDRGYWGAVGRLLSLPSVGTTAQQSHRTSGHAHDRILRDCDFLCGASRLAHPCAL
jgi:hypothetical protein